MGDVVTTFTANDQDVLKAYERLKKQNLELIEQQGRVKRAHQESGDVFKKFADEQVNSLTGMVTSLFTVEKAVEAVTGGYEEWREALSEVAAQHKEMASASMAAMAATGAYGESPRITKALGESGLGIAEASQAFLGAAEGGRTLGTDHWLGIVKAQAPLAGMAIDKHELGAEAGTLERFVRDITDEQAVGMALRVQRIMQSSMIAGELLSEGSMRAVDDLVRSKASATPQDALALAAAMVKQGANPEALARVAAAVDTAEPWRMPTSIQEMRDPLFRAKNRFVLEKDHSKRVQMLMGDRTIAEAMLGKRDMEDIAKVTPAQIEEIRKQLVVPGLDEEAGKARAGFLLTPEGRGLARSASAAVADEQAIAQLPGITDQQLKLQDVLADIQKERGQGFLNRVVSSLFNKLTPLSWPDTSITNVLGPTSPEELERLYAAAPSYWGTSDAKANVWRSMGGLFGGGGEFWKKYGLGQDSRMQDIIGGLEKEHPEQKERLEQDRTLFDAMESRMAPEATFGPPAWFAIERQHPERVAEFEQTHKWIDALHHNWARVQNVPSMRGPEQDPWEALERNHPEMRERLEDTRQLLAAFTKHAAALDRNTEATHANTTVTAPKNALRIAPAPVLNDRERR